jgi:hypothetical protein
MASRPEPDRPELLDPRIGRLSIPSPARIIGAGGCAFATGLALGIAQGGKTAELRFRAEHAHRMPTSTTGWYLYHKSKNYNAARAGLGQGLKFGTKLGFWIMVAFGLESAIDHSRGGADLLSTITASLTAAGGFSLWSMYAIPLTLHCFAN